MQADLSKKDEQFREFSLNGPMWRVVLYVGFPLDVYKRQGYDYDDFVETDEHTCLMLTRRKWSFRKFVKSIILKVKGMW